MKPYKIIGNEELVNQILKNATWGDVLFQASCGRVAVCREALFQDLGLTCPTRSMTWFDFCKYVINELGYDQPSIDACEPWARSQRYGRALMGMAEFNKIPNKEYEIMKDIWDGFYKDSANTVVFEDGDMWNVAGQFECWIGGTYCSRLLINAISPLGGVQWAIASVNAKVSDPTLESAKIELLSETSAREMYLCDVGTLLNQSKQIVNNAKKTLLNERDGFFAGKVAVAGEA